MVSAMMLALIIAMPVAIAIIVAIVVVVVKMRAAAGGGSSSTNYFAETLNFYNGIKIDGVEKDVYLTFTRPTATDTNGYTVGWLTGPNGQKIYPLPTVLKNFDFKKLKFGETLSIPMDSKGIPSLNFSLRINCDDSGSNPTYICERGDIKPVDGLDPVGRTHFKPDINTKLEFTFSCIEKDKSLCRINPSCLTDPTTCTGIDPQGGPSKRFDVYMSEHPTYRVGADGLLRDNMGTGVVIPLWENFNLPGNHFFDVSFVDGYTHAADIYVKRPVKGSQAPGVFCFRDDPSTPIDNSTTLDAQLILQTSMLNLDDPANCPDDENIYPAPRSLLANDPFRAINNPTGTDPFPATEQEMEYDIGGNGPPSTHQFRTTLVHNSQLSLKLFRHSSEKTGGLPARANFTSDYLGCASPCQALTVANTQADAQMRPDSSGTHTWPGSSYLTDPSTTSLSATDPGAAEVCCARRTSGGVIPGSSTFSQCNTTKFWDLSAGGTILNTKNDPNGNRGFGYYLLNYVSVLSESGVAVNPYFNLANGSKYVNAINMGLPSNDPNAPKGYAWQHEDHFKTTQCAVEDDGNLVNGAYQNYKYLVILGKEKPAGL